MAETHLVRAIIFVDFWNYTLNMQNFNPQFKTDWFAFPWAIAAAARECLHLPEELFRYEGMYVVGSYDQLSKSEINLRNWAQNTLTKVPGAFVDFKSRQKTQSGPRCIGPDHHEIANCPICSSSMLGTREKGVDTQIVTQMLRCAWEGLYDVGILVSEDRDFVPAVDHLISKGYKFIHARFPSKGFELRKHCWGEIDISKICEKFQRTYKGPPPELAAQ